LSGKRGTGVKGKVDQAFLDIAGNVGIAKITGNTCACTFYIIHVCPTKICDGGFVKNEFFVNFFSSHRISPFFYFAIMTLNSTLPEKCCQAFFKNGRRSNLKNSMTGNSSSSPMNIYAIFDTYVPH
jgi:hypothetical protein